MSIEGLIKHLQKKHSTMGDTDYTWILEALESGKKWSSLECGKQLGWYGWHRSLHNAKIFNPPHSHTSGGVK